MDREEPGGLQSMGSKRVRYDQAQSTASVLKYKSLKQTHLVSSNRAELLYQDFVLIHMTPSHLPIETVLLLV